MPERRRALVRRHHLDGGAASAEAVTAALLVLHATDPASVYLSVLARSARSTLGDVADAMYERRTLVRWMAMRRTLFLVPCADVGLVQAAVSTPLAATLRRQLISRLDRQGSEPRIEGDTSRWLADLEVRVEAALAARGCATGAQLGADVPALRTAITPPSPSERPQHVTSVLLTMMSAQGRIVRSTPTGAWTSRHHRWAPVGHWWPDGLPQLETAAAQRTLAERWLARFGPATVDDLQWWTGWSKTTTRQALEDLPVERVDLHGEPGISLLDTDADGDASSAAPVAALLPALDPTPMGWKRRDWFLGMDPDLIFDRSGNIGPTVWWDGEIVGSWGVTPAGELRTTVVADRGTAALDAIDAAAARLHARLGHVAVVPAVRTPLEAAIRTGAAARDHPR